MKKPVLYSVWRNSPDNDEIVAVDLPAKKCAEIMGISIKHFYVMVNKTTGHGNRWMIQKTG